VECQQPPCVVRPRPVLALFGFSVWCFVSAHDWGYDDDDDDDDTFRLTPHGNAAHVVVLGCGFSFVFVFVCGSF